jgi:hypothetical protein
MEEFDIWNFITIEAKTESRHLKSLQATYDLSYEQLQSLAPVVNQGLYKDALGETFSLEIGDRYVIYFLEKSIAKNYKCFCNTFF